MTSLNLSMRPVASFIFKNLLTESQRLCLFPGHFDTTSVVSWLTNLQNPATTKTILSYADPSAIVAAGYHCDQVADDFNSSENMKDGNGGTYGIQIKSKSPKTRYRDFLNYIKLSGVRVSKMRITDLDTAANPQHNIFYQEMEITKSSIGSKAGSDFVQFSSHINPANFLQNFIEVDLEKQNLLLDETTLAFLDIPANANFQIDFTLAE